MSRIYINHDWLFTPQFSESLLGAGMEGLETIRLPHTCKELPYHYFSEREYQMVCGYRKVLHVPEEWKGKRVLLTIDGAAHYAEVFLNGKKCGEHYSGYTAFTIDLSDDLVYGQENILTIRLDTRESLNIPPFGFVIDYMTYGGIYRDVYLDIKEPTYLADVFVKPEISGRLVSEVTIEGNQDGVTLRQFAVMNGQRTLIAAGNGPILEGYVDNVQLWDVDHPTLYEIETELIRDGRILDTHRVRVGFRNAEFRADGFYLNGRKLKIRGLNRHQSYPYVGYAMPRSMQEFDADILKRELGLNAVRTSHYPQIGRAHV